VLRPGACFLSAELDIRPDILTVTPNGGDPVVVVTMPATRELIRRMLNILQSLDPPSIPQALAQAGFQDVTSSVVWVPLGEWMDTVEMRTVGEMAVGCMLQYLDAIRPALLDQPGGTPESLDALLAQAQHEIQNTAGVRIPYYLVHARRPL